MPIARNLVNQALDFTEVETSPTRDYRAASGDNPDAPCHIVKSTGQNAERPLEESS